MNEPLACTAEELTLLAPLDALPKRTRDAVAAWLQQHGIDPDTVALGRPIHRDEHREMLVWREGTPDGVMVRTKLPGNTDGTTWPAPFPRALLKSA